MAAVRRNKWLIIALTIAGSAAGFAASRLIPAEYEVQATIWVAGTTSDRGPIRPDETFSSASWVELFKSGAVLDPVVHRLKLYVKPGSQSDWPALDSFATASRFRPGEYELRVSDGRYRLMHLDGPLLEEGAVGDSIGRRLGFRWQPSATDLGGRESLKLYLTTPRDASIVLLRRVQVFLPRTPDNRAGNLLRVTLTGDNPQHTAEVLNAWVEEFISAAARLKKRNLVELARVLEEQLRYAKTQLGQAEIALESFRISTITQPSEGTPLAAGVELTRDPVFDNFFSQKVEQDQVRRDREALERIVTESQSRRIAPESFFSLPTVIASAPNLSGALTDLSNKEAQLRSARQVYTDEHTTVRNLQRDIELLSAQTIPQLAGDVLAQLRLREQELDRRIQSASRELQAIPTRTIEEMRLRRQVTVQENLYTTLQTRFEEARLAEASAVPDVQALDPAVAPHRAQDDARVRILLMAVIGSLGAAITLALLLDHVDRRIRYPDQVEGELGLDVLGAIPTIRISEGRVPDPETAAQMVESFRTVRLGLSHALNRASPLMLTISSPNSGDGKSLVASNLALSFAEAGYRTLLIDGDIRRGGLHTMFSVERRPGLVDCLIGRTPLPSVVHGTSHPQLTLLPCGARRQRGPELLASHAMQELIAQLAQNYDAIIVDSPPLGAGIDAFALGVATGSMLLIVRPGETDRKLAQAKLTLLDKLPVTVVGAVLNDFKATSTYQHYSYDYAYATDFEDEHALPSGA
jgi:polysaccharide biosynthesis transport protein